MDTFQPGCVEFSERFDQPHRHSLHCAVSRPDPDEMTPGERARVAASTDGQRPVRMRRLAADRVRERLDSGRYEVAG